MYVHMCMCTSAQIDCVLISGVCLTLYTYSEVKMAEQYYQLGEYDKCLV